MHTRRRDIDLLRTIAIIMMIVFHTVYDLSFFFGWNIQPFSGFWGIWQKITATLFLGLVGVSFAIHASRSTTTQIQTKSFKRFIRISIYATLISISSYVFVPDSWIIFGILHCIAVSLLLFPFVANKPIVSSVVGAMLLLAGSTSTNVDTSLLIPLGFTPENFSSLDYFPLLPWLGVISIGNSIGYLIANKYIPNKYIPKIITLPGRYSIQIYFVHQPIILAILFLLLHQR